MIDRESRALVLSKDSLSLPTTETNPVPHPWKESGYPFVASILGLTLIVAGLLKFYAVIPPPRMVDRFSPQPLVRCNPFRRRSISRPVVDNGRFSLVGTAGRCSVPSHIPGRVAC
jgi:hypothetical protein